MYVHNKLKSYITVSMGVVHMYIYIKRTYRYLIDHNKALPK